MGIYRTDYHWLEYYSGDSAANRTFDVNLPSPTRIHASTSMYRRGGGGGSAVGIKSIRFRNASGSDEVKDFGNWLQWPPANFENKLTTITFAIGGGTQQVTGILARMEFWD